MRPRVAITYTLTAAITQPEELTNDTPTSGSVTTDERRAYYINVPADATSLTFETSISDGDADLFVKYSAHPDPESDNFDFASESAGTTTESITVSQSSNPPLQGGKWYVSVFGYDPSSFTLTATHDAISGPELLSYNIYRSNTPDARNTGTIVGNVDANTTTFNDIVSELGTFYYQVSAVYDQGESAPSNEASIVVTKVEEVIHDPLKYILGQNFPNPFYLTTRFHFFVPKRSLVNIGIFNIYGQKIRNLVNRTFEPGQYEIEWNGHDESGNLVISGFYIYQMRSSGYIKSKKMLFINSNTY
ncbi:MAG: PPC domain-containing protein [Marinilabiliaceae bacterium]|nr:PPC domain-containing protein [Marinilabiliaceae bacterium]